MVDLLLLSKEDCICGFCGLLVSVKSSVDAGKREGWDFHLYIYLVHLVQGGITLFSLLINVLLDSRKSVRFKIGLVPDSRKVRKRTIPSLPPK